MFDHVVNFDLQKHCQIPLTSCVALRVHGNIARKDITCASRRSYLDGQMLILCNYETTVMSRHLESVVWAVRNPSCCQLAAIKKRDLFTE
ncbi:hypothetical protein DdX_02095 [Ditylenchus destructor]|uniref:Uncharacterized protein n=1 Tax=Ditylenchus destructor TaxID=166010 RepID=A0AAD4NGZ9_9BILA|nr:hypothetical protein DdX_02095 [Ditylenchus destructor]